MKPFDIELAKAGHPVQTRDGRPVRIICYDRKAEFHHLVGLVPTPDGSSETPINFTEDGRMSIYQPTDLDLFMVTTKKEGWVNVYKNSKGDDYAGKIHSSEKEALTNVVTIGDKYISTTKIEYEE